MSEYCIEFRSVGKQLGGNWIFRDLKLLLPNQQITAMVGESGSGKTTLLQLVNGIHTADEGEVRVRGEPIPDQNIESFRRRIGYAVQGARLFPHMSIRKNVTILARMEGWTEPQIEERVNDLFELLGLELDLLDRYPYELSGGQQHRIGLCRALMLRPDLLLLDEPFSAIDPMTRHEIHEELLALQKRMHFSALLVTHDLREAQKLGDYLVVMAQGGISQQGTIDEVINSPANEYVRNMVEAHL